MATDEADALDLIAGLVTRYKQWRQANRVTSASDRSGARELQATLARNLQELNERFSGGFPFHSERYLAHMLSDISAPALLGYIVGLLHNENLVTPDASPVSSQLEEEACRRVLQMLGYGLPPEPPTAGNSAKLFLQQTSAGGFGWAHISSGGSSANIEALWVARIVRQTTLAIADVCRQRNLALTTRTPGGEITEARKLSPRQAWLLKPHDAVNLLFDYGRMLRHETGASAAEQNVWSSLEASAFALPHGIGAVLAEFQPLILVTAAAHYSISKAASLLGLGTGAVRAIPFDGQLRADPLQLREQLLSLSDEVPLCVVAVAGTTVDGTVDPLHEFATLRQYLEIEHNISFWLHADAAYGGYLRSLLLDEHGAATNSGCPETIALNCGNYQHALPFDWCRSVAATAVQALPQADSITCDNHKLGYNPYPSGLIAYKDDRVRIFIAQRSPYITSTEEDEVWQPPTHVSMSDEGIVQAVQHEAWGNFTLECSRPGAAASALWLATETVPLHSAGHGRLLLGTLLAARELYEWLRRWPEVTSAEGLRSPIEFVPVTDHAPDTNVVVFTLKPAGECTLEAMNKLARAMHGQFSISAELGEQRDPATQDFWLSKSIYRPRGYPLEVLNSFWQRSSIDVSDAPDNAVACKNRAAYEREGLFALRAAIMNPRAAVCHLDNGSSLILGLVQALDSAARTALVDRDSPGAGR